MSTSFFNFFINKSNFISTGIEIYLYRYPSPIQDISISIDENNIVDGYLRITMDYFDHGKIDIFNKDFVV